MDHYSRRRRHGLYPYEFGPVFRSVKRTLAGLLETRSNFPEAEALFKVLWRFENCRIGRPQYPKEISWQLIHEYINGPFSFSDDLVKLTAEEDQ
jgi:hypothetical protein